MIGVMRYLCTGLLAALTLTVVIFPRFTWWISGFRPLRSPRISELDELPKVETRGASRFFEERNRIEVTVPHDMKAAKFLKLVQLYGYPHIRLEMAKALQIDDLTDNTPLVGGTSFELTLTPPEEKIP